ncbi:MAG: diguanylate cyclase [Gammaproteobacteria bacterium]
MIAEYFGGIDLEEDLTTDLLVLQSHLDGMLESVTNNSVASRRYRDFEMSLLGLNSLSEIIRHVLTDAEHCFDVDSVSLCLVDEKGEVERLLCEEGITRLALSQLVFLKGKDPLQSILGFANHPFFGPYQNPPLPDLFFDAEKGLASAAIIPLNRCDKFLGTLNLASFQADRFSRSVVQDQVIHLGSVIGICLENCLNLEIIKRTSFVDTLTGVNNRRCFEQRFAEELDRCQRNADPISLLFLDIDRFKSINDRHGHQAGDHVLSLTAKAIKTQLRNNDVLARYGGEEFVALLSNINKIRAFEIAERMRKTVAALQIRYQDTVIPITVSIGLSTHLPDRVSMARADDVSRRLIRSADAALYRAKHNGRNRVELDGADQVVTPVDQQ